MTRLASHPQAWQTEWVLTLFSSALLAAAAGYTSLQGQSAVAATPAPASVGAQCEPPDTLLEHTGREIKRVALTFDACSSGTYRFDEKVYGTLVDMRVRATIFLGGEWIQKNRRTAHMIAANPLLEVANHGYHHPHLPTLSDHDVEWEIREGQAVAFKELSVFPRLFRAPYGEINQRVLAVAKRAQVTMVQYDLPSGDPDPNLKADKIVRWVIDGSQGGSIVVFHINMNGHTTPETLPQVVSGLRAKGFELVTVSELLGQPVTFTDGAFSYDPIVEQVAPIQEQSRAQHRVALLGK